MISRFGYNDLDGESWSGSSCSGYGANSALRPIIYNGAYNFFSNDKFGVRICYLSRLCSVSYVPNSYRLLAVCLVLCVASTTISQRDLPAAYYKHAQALFSSSGIVSRSNTAAGFIDIHRSVQVDSHELNRQRLIRLTQAIPVRRYQDV